MSAYPMNMNVPQHVPPHLVHDFDVYEISPQGGDFFAALYELKRKAPSIFWTRCNEGHWFVTDSELARHVGRSPELFSSHALVVPLYNNPSGRGFNPIHLDPPEHTKYRKHLSVALSRKSVAELTAGVRQLAIKLIEGLRPDGRCEFVTDFAFKLPFIIFLRLVDLPEEHRLGLLEVVGKIIRPGSDKAELIRGISAYLAPIVHERYTAPREDLISWLSQQEVDGSRIIEQELLSMCTLLLIGGLDSVANTLGFFVRFLADNPAHRRQLIEHPELLNSAVEELLRRFPTVTAGTGRICVADTVLGEVTIKPGDLILAPPAMMTFDDATYPNPLEVDFTRHIDSVGTFGQGPHRCVGANLARSELGIFLQEWLTRIPEFHVVPGETINFQPGVNISYDKIPLEWAP